MSDQYFINTIYLASEGEGQFIGSPQIFVRYQGCAIGCVNCDSKETWAFNVGPILSLEQVLEKISEFSLKNAIPVKRVSITGGDPLHPKHEASVERLVKELKSRGFIINIEASGTRVVDPIFDLVDFISFDFKTPSTAVKTPVNLLKKLIQQYQGKFQIKSVISDQKDFDYVLKVYKDISEEMLPWYLTPSYEPHEVFPAERFQMILELNQNVGGPFRVVGQQHKWVFGPEKKEV